MSVVETSVEALDDRECAEEPTSTCASAFERSIVQLGHLKRTVDIRVENETRMAPVGGRRPLVSACKLCCMLVFSSHWLGCLYALAYPFSSRTGHEAGLEPSVRRKAS